MSYKPGDTITKDPDAILDYDMEWADWLGDDEEIATSTWAITDTGDGELDIETGSRASSIVDGVTARVWLSGGTPGQTYTIKNHVVTDATPAREDDRSFSVKIRQR